MSKIRIHSLRLVWLEAFLAVMEQQSFSKAAETMGCKQSSVSRHVSELELWLGPQLFSPRFPPTPTDAALEFAPTARSVCTMLAESRTSEGMTKQYVKTKKKGCEKQEN